MDLLNAIGDYVFSITLGFSIGFPAGVWWHEQFRKEK